MACSTFMFVHDIHCTKRNCARSCSFSVAFCRFLSFAFAFTFCRCVCNQMKCLKLKPTNVCVEYTLHALRNDGYKRKALNSQIQMHTHTNTLGKTLLLWHKPTEYYIYIFNGWFIDPKATQRKQFRNAFNILKRLSHNQIKLRTEDEIVVNLVSIFVGLIVNLSSSAHSLEQSHFEINHAASLGCCCCHCY